MKNDLELILDLRILLKTVDQDSHFVQTDLFAIAPIGLSGYSLNKNQQVNGIKIGLGEQETEIPLMEIIARFKFLERLVFYVGFTFDFPETLATLSTLKYISLLKIRKIPEVIFERGLFPEKKLPYYFEEFTLNEKSILNRLKLFRKINPVMRIPDKFIKMLIEKNEAETASFNRDVAEDATPGLIGLNEELRFFCSLTKKSRQDLLLQSGLFIDSIEEIEEPPFELINQGYDAVNEYFIQKKKQGTGRLYEAKIVIVGAGESGKTTLIRKLNNPNHPVPNIEDKRTEGIRVTTYPFQATTKYGVKSIQAHIWDFGGQELYHTTHQLFLTPDTLYILLNDNRKNDTDFYYWLNIVTIRAGEESPILMIFNAKDNAARQIIPGQEIYSAFPNLIRTSIDVNFADKDITAIQKMKDTIEHYFTNLDVLGKPFPAYWVKVRDDLSVLTEEHINWNRFAEVCMQNEVNDVLQMQILAKTLHNLGVLLYFSEVFGLDDLIILKPQWCIDAIYAALDTKEIIDNGGRFSENTLARKWSDRRFMGNHLQLLKLMQHFDLCYKIDGTHDYIAPQLLPIEENILTGVRSWAIVFYFDYVFMPAGLITRLIARLSLYIKSTHAWRAGVVLEWEDGTVAEIIEHHLTHRIVIKINGPERKRRLLDIRKCLYDLQRDFKGIKFKETIACNCADCIKGGETTIYELKDLEDYAKHGDNVRCKNGTRKWLSAQHVLEGIAYEEKPRIFISYSHRNESFKDEFRTMISPMEKAGHWKIWDDRWLLPGDSWNKEIIRHLNESNIIVLMITADFFKSNFIYDIELTRAIQRHESGDALVIGIIVSDCMWEETPLSKIQILPKDGVAIERHPNRNGIWKEVANKIKETILVKQGARSRVGGWDQ
ncbi:COR domain-containing protein [Mucilaginibacter celer]|uniref:non-specific serine/threonine protein kinase n=1 Tax=Mucilaginibacter celer TaxID=2305508 RepID=A0A494W1W3_9SPHI|nr:COR domain-containing protein [Mucilaginibacter celer]AYL97743.1 TIR domain-containing protein [Mucilaginibacter celer]